MQQEHCIIHPIRKKPVVSGSAAIDYAADMMVILAYHKFLDDWRDEKSALGLSGKTALRGAYRKLRKKYPAVCRKTEEALMRLSELEKKESARPAFSSMGIKYGTTMVCVKRSSFVQNILGRCHSHRSLF